MTEYLDLDDLLDIAREAIGGDAVVGDYGLLESALARPRASVFGQDAYPDLHLKAAALLHPAWNHACWRKKDGVEAADVPRHHRRAASREDERFEFVIRVATGVLPDLGKVAEQLRTWSYPEG